MNLITYGNKVYLYAQESKRPKPPEHLHTQFSSENKISFLKI